MAMELLLAVALASLLLLHEARATVDNTTASCAPARCGDLSVTYPFSLSGVQPPYCGLPVLRLTCTDDGRRAYLDKAFTEHRPYRVQEISYDNSSLVVSVVEAATFAGDGTCTVPDFNVSSAGLLPLKLSGANRILTFVYDCEVPPSIRLLRPCANRTMGAYVSGGNGPKTTGVPTNCSFVSVPVREFHDGIMEPAPDRYRELISDGFLLEWTAAGNCAACQRSGAECRFVQQSFQCFCRDELLCSTTRQGIDGTARKIIIGMPKIN